MKINVFKDLMKEVDEFDNYQRGGCMTFFNPIENKIIGFKGPYSPPDFVNKNKYQ
jgi:hypothetical protein